MKKIFLIALVGMFSSVAVAQKSINWMSMDEALAAQKKEEPKKIFMDVYTVWCGPCKMLDKNTFSNKKVINYINKNFYAVKFNAEGPEDVTHDGFTYTNPRYRADKRGKNSTHFFADALKLQGYPSLVFFDNTGKLIQALAGYKTPEQLEIYLKMIASDEYKEVTTRESWEEYQNKFKSTF
jgi:thioredoxin-related protein